VLFFFPELEDNRRLLPVGVNNLSSSLLAFCNKEAGLGISPSCGGKEQTYCIGARPYDIHPKVDKTESRGQH
jgi:hypothetical protein